MQWVQAELMQQLRSGTIDSRRLPKPLRKLLDNQRWLPLELAALAALLQHEPRTAEARALLASPSGPHTSGIPPPKCNKRVRIA